MSYSRSLTISTAASAFAALSMGTSARAQVDLYSNGSSNAGDPGLSTGAVSGNGVAAPGGTAWSEVQDAVVSESNALGGVSVSPSSSGGSFRIADNVSVPGPFGWKIAALSLFVYQQPGSASSSPIASVSLRVWNGVPGSVGARVIFGDTTTNRLTSSSFANLYRVFNSDGPSLVTLPDLTRPVWRAEISLNDLVLQPGTYWLDWQATPTDTSKALFAPTVTVSGSRGLVGWNAVQFSSLLDLAGAWAAIVDPGKPAISADIAQDLPFIVRGTLLSQICGSDFNHDGFVTGDDYDAFADAFAAGTPDADFNGDGFVTGDDFDFYSDAFAAGC